MSALVRANYKKKDVDKYQKPERVIIIHFYDDNTALVLMHKEFVRLPLSELEWDSWVEI